MPNANKWEGEEEGGGLKNLYEATRRKIIFFSFGKGKRKHVRASFERHHSRHSPIDIFIDDGADKRRMGV